MSPHSISLPDLGSAPQHWPRDLREAWNCGVARAAQVCREIPVPDNLEAADSAGIARFAEEYLSRDAHHVAARTWWQRQYDSVPADASLADILDQIVNSSSEADTSQPPKRALVEMLVTDALIYRYVTRLTLRPTPDGTPPF